MALSGILAGVREVVGLEVEDQRLKAQASALQSHRDQQYGIQKEQNRLALLGLQQTGEHRARAYAISRKNRTGSRL